MAVEALLASRTKDLGGGFLVRRLLPSHPRQGVGPFVFFDHFGPVTVRPSDNFDVRPPNIVAEPDLLKPLYPRTTNYRHFGKAGRPWETPVPVAV